MDSSFLPLTKQNKTFFRFRIQNVQPGTPISTSGFYFIGRRNAEITEKLVKIFKKGYASEGFENAKAELTRCLLAEKNSIPEIIFCDAQFGFKEIESFCQFLNNHPILSTTPVVLDSANLSQQDWQLHKKAKLVDEIIMLGQLSDQAIISKCKFLKRVKQNVSSVNDLLMEETKIAKPNFKIILKRIFDIALAIVFLCLLAPIFVLIGLAISLETKGPVFYISKRAGMGYRIFNFYKFRTMQIDADKYMGEYAHMNKYAVDQQGGPFFLKIQNDPRITKVGAFLRNTGLDELPQLINVLLGDMSLVGNRPLPLYEAETLTTDRNAQRFLAPAGITGLWQIKKRGKDYMSAEERIKLDIDYAHKYNFMYDLWIMVNTLEYPVVSPAEIRNRMTSLS
jgi:lipopolysaccharide/colanic/teichoic acid biosynthesis glycosyltransferase